MPLFPGLHPNGREKSLDAHFLFPNSKHTFRSHKGARNSSGWKRSLRSQPTQPQMAGPDIRIGRSLAFNFHDTKHLLF